jgi:putative chitinase
LYAHHLDAACEAYEINTPLRLAHFLAQVGHESSALVHSREVWGPTPAQERYERNFNAPWPETPTESRRAEFAVNRLAYSLGNVQEGDGKRYCGHGLLQTTGRGNHRALRDRLRAKGIDAPDFEAAPELLEQPRWAALGACDYWDWRDINAMADRDDHEAVTRAVNGGTNGIGDRRRRLERAKAVLAAVDTTAPEPAPVPTGDPTQYSQEGGMPIPIAPVVAALAPTFLEMLPKLGAWFGSGSKVSERNMAVVGEAIKLAQTTVGAVNALDAVEKMQSDPAARAAVEKAVEANWYTLTEAGGGGIAAARAADQAAMNNEGPWWQVVRSPSFLFLLLAMPTVWAIVGSIVGLWGQEWPSDVRAAIATAVVSLVIGGAAGYYWGQTTSRNRAPAAS